MTDRLDKMRAKQPHLAAKPVLPDAAEILASPEKAALVEAIEEAKAKRAAEAKPAEAKPPPPKRPKKAAGATIRHQCGHEKAVAEYANMACPACRDKARQERVARKREKKAGTRREVAAAHGPNPEAALGKHLHGRLPDGARFEVSYDAATETWAGTLLVPADDGGAGLNFAGEGSGLFRLLHDLDRLYRNSIAPTQGD